MIIQSPVLEMSIQENVPNFVWGQSVAETLNHAGATPGVGLLGRSVADPECARGGGVSHILPEKRGVSFTLLKKCMKM